MYKQVTSSAAGTSENTDRDSKYTVAQILSSMTSTARQAPPITPVSFAAGVTPQFPVASSGAALLTPTSYAKLEQTIDLALQETNSQAATTESGFVPPVVNPIVIDPSTSGMAMGVKREYDPNWDDGSSCSSTDPDYNPTTGKRARMGEKSLVPHIDPNTYLMPNSRRPTGPRKERKNEILPPEEAEKRKVRRERNKQAAAKCRQRRVDQTNTLINETENLEEEKAELENEIHNLQKQKEELQFLLEAHRPACKHSQHMPVQQQHNLLGATPASSAAAISYPMSRPSTLPLRTTQAPATTAPVSLSTPSSGLSFPLGLDTMIDGHTGLTPLTAGPPPPSCGTQQRQNSSDNSSPNNSPNSSKLISL